RRRTRSACVTSFRRGDRPWARIAMTSLWNLYPLALRLRICSVYTIECPPNVSRWCERKNDRSSGARVLMGGWENHTRRVRLLFVFFLRIGERCHPDASPTSLSLLRVNSASGG